MKADERKALEKNLLADELDRAIDTIKRGPSMSTVFLAVLLLTLLMAFLAFRYFSRSSESLASERWTKLGNVVFPEQLNLLLSEADLRDTPQAKLAQFKEARLRLTQGLRDLGTKGVIAHKNIQEGTEFYEKLTEGTSKWPLLFQEALWGSGKGYEALGDLPKARSFYERLVKEAPNSALGKDAKKQLERLDSPAGQSDVLELSKAFAPPKS